MEAGSTARRPADPPDSLRPIAQTLAETVRVRASLLALEFSVEVDRRKHQVQLATLAAVLLYTAVLLLTVWVLTLFWDSHRNEAVALTCALYLVGAGLAWLRLRAIAASLPAPFADSLHEFRRDLAEWTGSP
jgi:uncharacterized membrane protein YqjE